jgi:hypothetical protein
MSYSNFTQQSVLIVGDGTLFDEFVTQKLTHGANLFVSHTTYSGDLAFLNSIKSDQPDVILVNETSSLETAHILDLASSHPKVGGLRILIVRLSDNMIYEYASRTFDAGKTSCRPQQITVRTGEDLLNAVRRKNNAKRESRNRIPQ